MWALQYKFLIIALSITVTLYAFAQNPPQSIVSNLHPANPPAQVFTIDGAIKKRVEFWIQIYTKLSTSEGYIHDAKYSEIILEKMDFKDIQGDPHLTPHERDKKIQKRIKDVKKFYKTLFLSLHKKQNYRSMTQAEKRIFELYAPIQEPNKFFYAAHNKRIRFQLGQRDRFLQGLFYSGRYLSLMEKIFRMHGVPIELTHLPFVESSFNLYARSKVGASGVWQFMRSTGRLYLKINDTIDERNDPIRATEAAAQLLKLNYESLGNWPLAITAYNHGRKGLMRAVRKVGSESLDDIIEGYRSRSFGFASSNFYAEFLAATEIEKNVEKYFGKIERAKPIEFSEMVINDYVEASDLATYSQIPLDILREFNPSLTENVFQGKRRIPAGFILRIPPEMKEKFLERYNIIPPNKKFSNQKGPSYDLYTKKVFIKNPS